MQLLLFFVAISTLQVLISDNSGKPGSEAKSIYKLVYHNK